MYGLLDKDGAIWCECGYAVKRFPRYNEHLDVWEFECISTRCNKITRISSKLIREMRKPLYG